MSASVLLTGIAQADFEIGSATKAQKNKSDSDTGLRVGAVAFKNCLVKRLTPAVPAYIFFSYRNIENEIAISVDNSRHLLSESHTTIYHKGSRFIGHKNEKPTNF